LNWESILGAGLAIHFSGAELGTSDGFHSLLWTFIHNDTLNALGRTNDMFADAFILSGDVLVHHGIALGLHVSVLILLKAALNARSSKLFPDKEAFGYGFPCDGPGRGGTC
jgi:photosystem I P700 chlorophyll a apoprotein A2